MVYDDLDLGEGYACCGVICVVVCWGEVEAGVYRGAKVVVDGEGFLIL